MHVYLDMHVYEFMKNKCLMFARIHWLVHCNTCKYHNVWHARMLHSFLSNAAHKVVVLWSIAFITADSS